MASPDDPTPPRRGHSVVRRGVALLWRSVRTHPVPFAVSLVGATVFAVMTVVATAALGRVTDEVIVPGLAEEGDGTFGGVDGRTVLVVTGAVVVIALARALVRRPRLLVLDDATSAIDPSVEAQILTGLGDALATTTVVVAHRVSTIRLADRVLFLEGGRVAALGAHEDLLRDVPAYGTLVRAYETEDDVVDVGAVGER